jgi:hypothetical protein
MQKGDGPWTARTSNICCFFRADEQAPQRLPIRNAGEAGVRVVHGDKELVEKVGRNDLCPCGSGKRFKKCCRNTGCF